ncbi:peptidylprolyl isomerase [Chamaesiphon minutus]|uniref:peptidylprolyl isomerase n=1 Tax=Chamaesiphon minutus (strain ATCC 27169 / PCC 6605) TaxID=1173020 RepID=K9UHE3_CHAP6|nr:peptidylprolyl isomerase [Chamaesiphon minutus]AFY94068.1 parvulin-like peptidyl-prolyl isomerase [Chamaesiphon minutus PCC 6605]
MKTTANLQDPSIVTSTFPFPDRPEQQQSNELDTPLKRLYQNAISGEEVIALLQKYWMLPQLHRELILDEELASIMCSQEEIFSAYKAFYQKYQINSDEDRAAWLERNNCTLEQFEHSVMRTLKLDRFKQLNFNGKVDSYFLQRKAQLDRATYSLLRVKDPHLAQELFFRIQDKEATFTELVKQYSGGQEAEIGGLVGPHELSVPHPLLAQKLSSLKPGQLSTPVQIADWFVVVRLEKYLPAQLDKTMRSRLVEELYEQWLQAKLAQLIKIKK